MKAGQAAVTMSMPLLFHAPGILADDEYRSSFMPSMAWDKTGDTKTISRTEAQDAAWTMKAYAPNAGQTPFHWDPLSICLLGERHLLDMASATLSIHVAQYIPRPLKIPQTRLVRWVH